LGIHGMYCYHDLITDQTIQLGENLTSTDPNVQPVWLGIIGSIATGAAAEAGTGSAFIGGTGTGVLGLGVGTAILYGGAFIGVSIGVAAMLYEPYLVLYEIPERLRILKEINDMKRIRPYYGLELYHCFYLMTVNQHLKNYRKPNGKLGNC